MGGFMSKENHEVLKNESIYVHVIMLKDKPNYIK